MEIASQRDIEVMSAQLGRPARGAIGVGWRCPCGNPAATVTAPRLPDGSPFPTTYYLCCPKAVFAVSRLESSGLMATYNARLAAEPELAAAYARAHQAYLDARAALPGGDAVPELDGISAGGMPKRVKCLHALLAHALAAGPGVNPIGDEVRELIGEFWNEPCLPNPPCAPANPTPTPTADTADTADPQQSAAPTPQPLPTDTPIPPKK